MRNFLLVILITFLVISATPNKLSKKSIVLDNKDSVFAFKGEVNEALRDAFVKKIYATKGDMVIVYIDSPGGSVFSLNDMLDHMISNQTSKKFICVARFAASAAFIFLQHCDERYMLPSGIIMSHNASMNLAGDVPNIQSLLKLWQKLLDNINERVAKRMKLPLKDYKNLIKDDLWLDFYSAKRYNAIDGVSNIACTYELINQKIEKKTTSCSLFQGCKETVNTVSACPLVD